MSKKTDDELAAAAAAEAEAFAGTPDPEPAAEPLPRRAQKPARPQPPTRAEMEKTLEELDGYCNRGIPALVPKPIAAALVRCRNWLRASLSD